jgi:hypothetical protein
MEFRMTSSDATPGDCDHHDDTTAEGCPVHDEWAENDEDEAWRGVLD